MSMSREKLHNIPLFRDFSDAEIELLTSVFEPIKVPTGSVLFEAGSEALNIYVLVSGEVELRDQDTVKFRLHSPTLIGELGGLTALPRNTTAVAAMPSEVWRVSREALIDFFQANSGVAFSFYRSLTTILTEKLRRDHKRAHDMRTNLIRTQKAMKQMRDFLLESQDTPVSETVHDTLEMLIRHNRRANYRVSPPDVMPASLRLDSGESLAIVEISRSHLSFAMTNGSLPHSPESFSGVLHLSDDEIPISGTVLRTIGSRVDLQLDLLIEEYSGILDDYLTNVQLLDFVV